MSANAFNPGRAICHPVTVDFAKPKFGMEWEEVCAVLVTIDGEYLVGRTLTCNVDRPRSMNLRTVDFARQWLRDGVPILGATGRKYTLTADDIDHDISCFVTDARGITSASVRVVV